MMPATLAADPASADNERDEVVRHYDYPVYGAVVVDEVTYHNVGERSRPDGEYSVEYDDIDGLVAEWDVT